MEQVGTEKKYAQMIICAVLSALLVVMTITPAAFAGWNDNKRQYEGTITVEGADSKVTAVKAYRVIDVDNQQRMQEEGVLSPFSFNFAYNGVGDWVATNYSSLYYDVLDQKTSLADPDVLDEEFYTSLYAAIKSGVVNETGITLTKSGNNWKATNVVMGQYIIVPTGGTEIYAPTVANLMPSLSSDGKSYEFIDTATVTLKSSSPTNTKHIIDESGDLQEYNTVSSGDTISYVVEFDVPDYPSDALYKALQITDKMTAGLTYNQDVTLYAGEYPNGTLLDNVSGTFFSVAYSPTEVDNGDPNNIIPIHGDEFTVTFDYDAVSTYEKMYILYTANADRIKEFELNTRGYTNWAGLTYNNDPYVSTTYTTNPKETRTFSYGVHVYKTDSAGDIELAGAVFDLYSQDADGEDWSLIESGLTSNERGYIDTWGHNIGKYKLVETQAPTLNNVNYNLLPEPIVFTIVANEDNGIPLGSVNQPDANISGTPSEGFWALQVLNYTGLVFPATGDIGTVVFTVVGFLCVIAAGIIFVSLKKRSKVKDEPEEAKPE